MSNVKGLLQRLVEVQKEVTTVIKNEKVEVTKNNSYKAVTHDDVAALLHMPLAKHGIIVVPTITDIEHSTLVVKTQYGEKQKFRTDLKIKVTYINADNPKDFIETHGGAFAFDSADKAPAKAYSLALKTVLLKMHLLESRDEEEKRDKDIEQGQAQSKSKPKPPPHTPFKGNSTDYVMPYGNTKGSKLNDLTEDQLKGFLNWSEAQFKQNPKLKNNPKFAETFEHVQNVLDLKKQTSSDEDPFSEFSPPPPEEESQESVEDQLERMRNEYGQG